MKIESKRKDDRTIKWKEGRKGVREGRGEKDIQEKYCINIRVRGM